MFWKQLDQVLNSGSEGSRLFDAAILKYNVKGHLLPEDTGNAEAMVNKNKCIFLYQDSDFIPSNVAILDIVLIHIIICVPVW